MDNFFTLSGEVANDGIGDDDFFCEIAEICQDGVETIGDDIEIFGDLLEIPDDGIGNDDGICDPIGRCNRQDRSGTPGR